MNNAITDYHAKYFAHLLTRKGGSGIDRLTQSLFDASVDLNPHQIESAAFALANPVSEGVLLADEVGLGKTIEAGLVLCQLWAEGKRRLLVVCPASLRKQWAGELEEKFHLPTRILETGTYRRLEKDGVEDPFDFQGVVIISFHFAVKHDERVTTLPWDLVVIDEAHKLRNAYRRSNKMGRAIRSILRGRRKILLTATPLQNSIMELYGLTTFIDEYAFGDPVHFRAMYAKPDRHSLADLKERIQPYYTRTLRKNVLEYIRYTERKAITRSFYPADEEQRLYDELNEYLQREDTYAFPSSHRHLSILIVRKVLASSSAALVGTLEMLEKRLKKMLIETAEEEPDAFEDFLFSEDIDEDLLDEILEDIEEYEEDTEEEEAEAEIDREKLKEEIRLVEKFIVWARSIHTDEKSRALITALTIGFKELQNMGASQKAVIFTESRRTQRYLKDFLEANGYAGKVVTFNGSNTEAHSRVIYEQYKAEHQDDGTLTGSKVVDIRTAIIEKFRDESQIMIATEAAAEGVNLQFCSLVVNYDLPWNPQRIEQRIGRCHRYGQKYDVVVINFINQRNEADQRVYELLSEKFHLFTGVFGASDDVIGTLESGVDIERQVLDIYQTCRTEKEIEEAFARLRKRLDERIQSKIEETRRLLMEQFDEDVHRRLKFNLEHAQVQVRRTEELFWKITKHVLQDHARFYENFSFYLSEPPLFETPEGFYTLISQNKDGAGRQFLYRLSHPLGEYVLAKSKAVDTPPVKLMFDISSHSTMISQIEALKGKSGYLTIEKLTIEGAEIEEHVLVSGTIGVDASLSPEVAEKLWNVEASIVPYEGDISIASERVLHEAIRHRKAIVSESIERTNEKFEEEREKLVRWADDKTEAEEQKLANVKAQIRSYQREARKAETVDQQKAFEEKIQVLQKKKKRIRAHIFDVEDEIEAKRDELIDMLEKRMNHTVDADTLFTIEWEVV